MSYPTDINDLADRAHDYLVRNGFCAAKDDHPPTDLMLIVTEVAEAMEVYRTGHNIMDRWVDDDGKPQGFVIELADIIIRCIALAAHHSMNIQQAIWDKMLYNETRPFMHGGKIV